MQETQRIFLVCAMAVLAACEAAPLEKPRSAFDGVWTGATQGARAVGTNGMPCVGATATLQIVGGEVSGMGDTSYGPYRITGSVAPDGKISGAFLDPKNRSFGSFQGSYSDGEFSGNFEDSEECNGTWYAKRRLQP